MDLPTSCLTGLRPRRAVASHPLEEVDLGFRGRKWSPPFLGRAMDE